CQVRGLVRALELADGAEVDLALGEALPKEAGLLAAELRERHLELGVAIRQAADGELAFRMPCQQYALHGRHSVHGDSPGRVIAVVDSTPRMSTTDNAAPIRSACRRVSELLAAGSPRT